MPQEFTTDQLAPLGLPASTLRGWIDRGFVKPRSLGRGPNQGPRWSFAEAVQLVGASRLSALGVPLADALPAAEGAAMFKGGYLTVYATPDRDWLAARTLPDDESLLTLLRRPDIASVSVVSIPELQSAVVQGLNLPAYPAEIETDPPLVLRDESELDVAGIYQRRRQGVAAVQAELAEIRARGEAAEREVDEGR